MSQTAASWRRAYELEPPLARDFPVDMLSRGLAGELAALDPLGRCAICDRPGEPVMRGKERIHCSHACQRIANGRLLDLAA